MKSVEEHGSEMASSTQSRTTLIAGGEHEGTLPWRHAALLAAGYDRYALELALSSAIDIHLAVGLRERSCPPEIAARILL